MFEKDIEVLVGEMTSFYKEHLPVDSSYEKILNAYIQSFLALWQEAIYLRKHISLEEAPTLKDIKYAKIDIEQALYTKKEARELSTLTTLEEKIGKLNDLEKYVLFEFTEMGSRTPIVYDINLKSEFNKGESLSLYDDYFVRNNKLYLLPDFVLGMTNQSKVLHGFDIKVDNYMIEKKWGTYFDIETGPLLPRYKYRDVISAFKRLLSSDLSIRQMKEAVRLATDWEEFDILDRHSPQLHPNIKKMYDEWMISPARFIISLPEELIKEKIYLNVLLSLMDESKEAHVNYLVMFHIIRLDIWLGEDKYKVDVGMGLKDIFTPEDTNKEFLSMNTSDSLFPQDRYDVGRHYEYKMKYDSKNMSELDPAMDGGEFVLFDDPNLLMDKPWVYQTEWYKVDHVEFPEIPRELVAEYNSEEITLSFKTNSDGTTHYELLGSTDEYGEYVVVNTISNNEASETNSLIHNASGTGMRYYKVRAIAGADTSLATIAVDTSTL